jgi:predicted metallo-beta-lactamase superfamily hydrolase
MPNLLYFLKDVLAGCSVMHGDQFNQFFINIKFTVTGPDEDHKLCYSSDVNGLINNNRKMFNSL